MQCGLFRYRNEKCLVGFGRVAMRALLPDKIRKNHRPWRMTTSGVRHFTPEWLVIGGLPVTEQSTTLRSAILRSVSTQSVSHCQMFKYATLVFSHVFSVSPLRDPRELGLNHFVMPLILTANSSLAVINLDPLGSQILGFQIPKCDVSRLSPFYHFATPTPTPKADARKRGVMYTANKPKSR